MKTIFSFSLLFISFCPFAQNEYNTVINIRRAVEKINRDTGYSIRKLTAEDFLNQVPDNGGELTGYFKKGQLVKIIEWIGLSSCVKVTEYYLQGDKLIFTYTKGSESPYIDSLQEFDHSKLNTTMEYRFYFDNNKVVKKILNGSTRCSGRPTADLSKEYLDLYLRYKKLLVNK